MRTANLKWDEQRFLAKVQKTILQRGRYAGHWEGGEKPIKERAILCGFLRSQEDAEGSCWIANVLANPVRNVAPDCISTNIQGSRVGYEVTELVDELTVRRNKKRFSEDKEWEQKELIEKVQSILARKDACRFIGGPFDRVILIVYTSEPQLRRGEFNSLLTTHVFSPCHNISEAYLLFPHVPWRTNYPYVRLRLG